jgi:protein-S-isoprenylcysteine O-methyltransferase Ste14
VQSFNPPQCRHRGGPIQAHVRTSLIKPAIGAGLFPRRRTNDDAGVDTARRFRTPRRALRAGGEPNRYVQPERFVGDGVNSRRARFVFRVKGTTMAAVALALYIAFGVLALGWRCWMQRRHTGSTGYRGLSRRRGLLGLVGGIAFIVAMVGGLAAPLLQLLGVVSPPHILDHRWVNAAGFALAVCGLAATLYAQLDMGESWRVGVDTSETTPLVRTGAFKLIRNPIFAAMLVFTLGQTLLAPNPVAIAVFAIFVAAVEVSVRAVEEPYLLGVHGADYRDYTASVGRFVPRIGLTR